MPRFLKLFLSVVFLLAAAEAQADFPAILHSVDRLVRPGDHVMLKARLMSGGLGFLQRPISGERVEFFLDEESIGQALTGGDGWAAKRFKPPEEGILVLSVQLPQGSKLSAEPAELILSVVPPSTPLILVHLSTTRSPSRPPAIPFSPAPTSEPMEGAVEELEKLSESFQLVYLETGSESLSPRFREWIFGQGFPEAPLMIWPVQGSSEARKGAIKAYIRELRQAGWKNIRAGLTRSAADAEAFKELKIKSILMVEEDDDPEDVPEGVQVLSAWPEVGSFLKGR